MKHSDQDRFLKEILAGEELDEFRSASLEATLAGVRTRKRRQRACHRGALLALPLLIGLCFLLSGLWRPQVRVQVPQPPEESPDARRLAGAGQNGSSGVKLLTDDELIALFPNRPLALIGAPDDQRLVFLDKMVPAAPPISDD